MAKTYKQIESSRNTRLWITSVFMPIVTAGSSIATALYMGNPDFRCSVNEKMYNAKLWFKHVFKKNK